MTVCYARGIVYNSSNVPSSVVDPDPNLDPFGSAFCTFSADTDPHFGYGSGSGSSQCETPPGVSTTQIGGVRVLLLPLKGTVSRDLLSSVYSTLPVPFCVSV